MDLFLVFKNTIYRKYIYIFFWKTELTFYLCARQLCDVMNTFFLNGQSTCNSTTWALCVYTHREGDLPTDV